MSTLISRILAEKLGKTPSNGVNQIQTATINITLNWPTLTSMVYATNLMKLNKFLTANYLTCYLLVRLKLIIPYEIELKHPSFCRL